MDFSAISPIEDETTNTVPDRRNPDFTDSRNVLLSSLDSGDSSKPVDLSEPFRQIWPAEIWSDVPTVIGVSGGADSILLAELVYRARLEYASESKPSRPSGFAANFGRIVIAHANHNLRGAESDGDEEFVRAWYESRKSAPWLAFRSVRLNIRSTSDGLENDCRSARYRWLEQVCTEFGARYLLTAHNSDDQVETILYRIFRGTGLDGLSGIPAVRRVSQALTIVRPILSFSRQQIERQLRVWDQTWRTDSSNLSNDYSRNQIRNELLPWIERNVQANARNSILRLGDLARQAQATIQEQIDKLILHAAVCVSPDHIDVLAEPLKDATDYLVSELIRCVWTRNNWPLQAMGREEWTLLTRKLRGQPEIPTRMFPDKIQAIRYSDRLTLRRI